MRAGRGQRDADPGAPVTTVATSPKRGSPLPPAPQATHPPSPADGGGLWAARHVITGLALQPAAMRALALGTLSLRLRLGRRAPPRPPASPPPARRRLGPPAGHPHRRPVLQPFGPSTTTRSPTASPWSPRSARRRSRRLDGAHRDLVLAREEIDVGARRAPQHGRRRHQRRVAHGVDVEAGIDELVGKQRSSLLGNSARSFTVPVVTSIWLSTVSRLPRAISVVSDRSKTRTGRVAPARRRSITRSSTVSGRVNSTEIGWSWVTTTMPVEAAVT